MKMMVMMMLMTIARCRCQIQVIPPAESASSFPPDGITWSKSGTYVPFRHINLP
jgi:hypothetical protein